MLSLTKKTEYALIALCDLAQLPTDSVVSARDLAGRNNVPLSIMMNLLKLLAGTGFVKSVRGANGGYRLDRSAAHISLAEVIEVIDGPMRFVQCAGSSEHQQASHAARRITTAIDGVSTGSCELECSCIVRDPLRRVHERMRALLDGITVAELAVRPDRSRLTVMGT